MIQYIASRNFICLVFVAAMLACGPPLPAQPTAGTIKLENEHLEVSLRNDVPAITAYRLKDGNRILRGDVKGTGPGISFFRGGDQVLSNWTTIRYSNSISPDGRRVTYHASADYQGIEAIEFDLVYTLTPNGLDVTYEKVVEHENFYLIYILLPELITVNTGDVVARLAIPADAGRLIDVKTTRQHELEYEIDWLHPILAGMAYNDKAIGILDTKSIENHSIASVFDHDGKRYGSFSMKFMHRLMEYDLHEFGPVVPVTDPAKLLKVQDSSTLSIFIHGDYDRDGKISWIDGTKVLRDHIDAVPNPAYKGKSFVRTFVDRPPTRRDTTGLREELKFSEVLQRIKKFAAQTDSAAYVMYLLGWQYEGHDSGYPSVDKVNENLGGYDALVNLIEEAKKYNVNVSFYDNYDDSYPTHPGWDPEVICIDPQGQMIKGGVWEGSQSYLINPHKYVMKNALERVRFTLDTYPVQGSYFIDVLSGGFNGGRKYDFDPKNPSGAILNFEAKLRIIEAFNKRGIDIATEDFTGYFVGHVGTFGNIIAFDNVYFENEVAIPFIPFVYHSKTSYGMKISDRSKDLRRFIYGHRAEKFTNKRSVFTPADYIL
ncbi:MAG: endo-alpha-N-acetylgalactosaminidase family protein, partial [Bacteroidota bacterium]|nr:endo-alpha-N-acetylgalactosaminidase family protein [Bacteroidota bacterium]